MLSYLRGACRLAVSVLCLTATAHADDLWQSLAPFASPPAEFAEATDELRSPLQFNDGRRVTTPEQWAERRKEILADWHALMGAWPPVIERPTLETLETTHRDNFTRLFFLAGFNINARLTQFRNYTIQRIIIIQRRRFQRLQDIFNGEIPLHFCFF